MRWEYLATVDEGQDIKNREKFLDKAGKLGWELVCITGRTDGFNPVIDTVFLKVDVVLSVYTLVDNSAHDEDDDCLYSIFIVTL